ncbi:protein of unknown function [Ruminococcaceae bacterium BL-4]|nr:protein of unknown function [Ruminococcaceae bacterium BL-4]
MLLHVARVIYYKNNDFISALHKFNWNWTNEMNVHIFSQCMVAEQRMLHLHFVQGFQIPQWA